MQTFSDYKKQLNFKVTKTYDDKIKALVNSINHCKVYEFDDETSDWQFTNCQGPMMLYERYLNIDPQTGEIHGNQLIENEADDIYETSQLTGEDGYRFGLMVFNRSEQVNFSLGIANDVAFINRQRALRSEENKDTESFFPVKVDLKEDLIILKSHLGQVYGFWIENEGERLLVFNLLKQFVTLQWS